MIHQASIEADAKLAERIARAFEEALDPAPIAVGLFERANGRFEVFAHYDAAPSCAALAKLIAAAAQKDLAADLRIEALAQSDWVTLSQGKRPKVEAGRFLVHGSHDRPGVPPRLLKLEIDAGQAFGTAHHASTRGCLLALDAVLKQRRPRAVIDLGTGTGVLAIAAAKALRQATVIATDNDKIAVSVAAENAQRNAVRPLLHILKAEGFRHPRLRSLKADLLLANLLESALYDLAPELERHLAPRGVAILSGLTEAQARGIASRYLSFGFALEKRIILDGWTTLVISRRSRRKTAD